MVGGRFSTRVDAAAVALLNLGDNAALVVTPGASLRYLTGYDALPLERLTCLLAAPGRRHRMLVPRLELAAARAAGVEEWGVEILPWDESDDPFALVATTVGPVDLVAVDDAMPAATVLRLREVLPAARQVLAGSIIDEMRLRKSADEVQALAEAGAAIDSVHARMGEWLRAGRTEREVARDIADAILEAGHRTVDFVIVASGPNGASPHHDVSDRTIGVGEPVVVDIGGTMPSGYCSDSTRMYCVGQPPAEFAEQYTALRIAQEAAVAAARPGLTAEALDAVARTSLAGVGLADAFIHRTGHGIGMSTHEPPYIVAGNAMPLDVGMAFSIEPGFYLEGRWGARLEDIVVLHDHGAESVNRSTHDLVIL